MPKLYVSTEYLIEKLGKENYKIANSVSFIIWRSMTPIIQFLLLLCKIIGFGAAASWSWWIIFIPLYLMIYVRVLLFNYWKKNKGYL